MAEEVGFVGAIGAATNGLVPKNARLVCLENSRSFPESPIHDGPIVRVGDRMTVFSPDLTNDISTLMTAHAAATPSFKWQRKLMAGGACEATAFSAFGFQSTCLCLPLGNYHNMQAIDDVVAGQRPAKVGPEFIGDRRLPRPDRDAGGRRRGPRPEDQIGPLPSTEKASESKQGGPELTATG